LKLRFDENLSPKLPRLPAREYPGSAHVGDLGMRGAADHAVWAFAGAQGFAIVSKDTDFRERSFLEGAPPKIIWLDVGNAVTSAVAELLRRERQRAEAFATRDESSFLILSAGPHRPGGL
jgi:predicted nuclease of predicted toxin-antitoxin system